MPTKKGFAVLRKISIRLHLMGIQDTLRKLLVILGTTQTWFFRLEKKRDRKTDLKFCDVLSLMDEISSDQKPVIFSDTSPGKMNSPERVF